MFKRLQALAAQAKSLSSGALMKKLALAGLMLAAVGVAFFLGRKGALSDCQADPPQALVIADPNTATVSTGDYAQRVVAYIYGNVPITRE